MRGRIKTRNSGDTPGSGSSKRQALFAAIILLILGFISIFAGLIVPYDPLVQNIDERLQRPSSVHIFGTDGFGRDVFSRVVYGVRVSLYVALLSVVSAVILGIPIGAYTAYRGGWLDLAISRIVDTFLGFPFIVLAVIVVVALESSPTSVAVAIASVLLPRIIVLTRTAALAVKNEPYIDAASMIGAGNRRVVFFHLLPNCIGPPFVQAVGYFGTAIATESILSYLGLGVPPPYPSWGRMIQEGTRLYFEAAPWLVIFPGFTLFAMVIGFSWFAENLRRTMNGS